jgi:hypothetical protein
MKRLLFVLALVAALGPPALAQRTLYVSPDVPTDDPGGSGAVFQPWEVVAHKGGLYALVLSLPANTAIDAVHKMDRPGRWLLSVEATAELPPGSGVFFQPEDVIRLDGAIFTMFFDGSAAGVPPGVNVDGVFLVGNDSGTMVVSFDVPATIAAATYEPADLVRYAGGAFSLFFDASAAGGGVAASSDAIASDESAGRPVLGFDVPTDLAPSTGPVTYLRGTIADWDGASFNVFGALAGWPPASEVAALSCQANPGRVHESVSYPFFITLSKSLTTPGNVIVNWPASCSSGAEDYGIYEGTIGSWYSHVRITPVGGTACVDQGSDLTEEVAPGGGNTYYLVVPHNAIDEGAYGRDRRAGRVPLEIERPPAPLGSRCAPTQIVTTCP